jgi:hypothetical protein
VRISNSDLQLVSRERLVPARGNPAVHPTQPTLPEAALPGAAGDSLSVAAQFGLLEARLRAAALVAKANGTGPAVARADANSAAASATTPVASAEDWRRLVELMLLLHKFVRSVLAADSAPAKATASDAPTPPPAAPPPSAAP